jgi:hypothetical protein
MAPGLQGVLPGRMWAPPKSMKRFNLRTYICILFGICFWGCQATTTPPREHFSSAARQVRNNAYSLLYDLLKDEQHVSKLLIIKRDRRELHHLIKRVSATAKEGAEQLQKFAKQDASFNLEATELPPAEQAARKAIADTKRKKLLASSGAEFEKNLLLTQAQALSYAIHLAQVAAKEDDDEPRLRFLSGFRMRLEDLYEQVVQLLFAPSPPSQG